MKLQGKIEEIDQRIDKISIIQNEILKILGYKINLLRKDGNGPFLLKNEKK